ncbi:DUF4489 domain-containing protein [Clostridiaceae bacterium UIB06]|uniref:DUF4489 domain-containing protein n=1 Tax=Clostridium thailandense TaxID=2794346 RepID=A0A949TP40_9CLOT|nr:DUF4489 domain-containing protein [Clostridium thailandense]MBV7272817.1 DUF4489 domain-containing protein [Clostridium thailandense]MCH5137642.1 DUF4489 domain-containing protein [Clostridiaceae bacterium UIB06]
MNSMSRTHFSDDCNPCKKEEKHCTTVVKCGSPSSTTIPAATVAGTTFTVTSLTLDTSKLCDPTVKLEFASNIVAAVAFTGTINFQVFKICRGQLTPVPVGPAWTLSETALLFAETFSFFICDCNFCYDECCTYTVVATVTSAVTVGTLAINNATLGAVAASGTGGCC